MYGNPNHHQGHYQDHQYQPPSHLTQQQLSSQQQQQNHHQHAVNSSGYCCDCQSYTMTSQWYHPTAAVQHHHPVPPGSYNYLMDTPPSNSREQRNKAEKQRRDKLNSFITELACLVPMVFNSPKRMDKTSILRLSATHLRIYQTLNGSAGPKLDVPKNVDQNIIENLVCDELNGFLLILTASGKVVFVSQTVETLLGHLQTDLMGQTIFTITAPEDHDRLRLYITQSEDSGTTPTGSAHCKHHISDRDWRKYFNIRLKRAGPRSEPPVYESVNVMGMQRPSSSGSAGIGGGGGGGCFEGVVNGAEGQQGSGGGAGGVVVQAAGTSDMWVFFVRLYRPEAITNMLMEASKDEYVTRHYVDGRIIDCDQRISLIAGYMIEEINGLSAFNFMHKEDVHWVIVALRQMYDRGESRGNSCYRLQSKTGQFIYLRTFGFLEADSTGTVETFICVNSLVTEREGLQLISEMKERYSALVNGTSSNTLSITEGDHAEAVEDPQTIEVAIENLLHNLPTEADITYQELTSASKMKSEPPEYINYSQSPSNYSSSSSSSGSSSTTNGNVHVTGVKRPASGISPYNNSSKHRKVTKLLMRPTSNTSANRATPVPMLSPTQRPPSQQSVYIKQEDPPSPLHSYASPPGMHQQQPHSPLRPLQSPTGSTLPPSPTYVQQQHSVVTQSLGVGQVGDTGTVGQRARSAGSVGQSRDADGHLVSSNPMGIVQSPANIMIASPNVPQHIAASPGLPMHIATSPGGTQHIAASPGLPIHIATSPGGAQQHLATMEHSYPYRSQISPGSNSSNSHHHIQTILLSNVSNTSPATPLNSNTYNPILSPTEAAVQQELDELNRGPVQCNGRKVTEINSAREINR